MAPVCELRTWPGASRLVTRRLKTPAPAAPEGRMGSPYLDN